MGKKKVNIICLYWVGSFRGRKFSVVDVERLKASVDKHIDRPYDFYCLTNYEGKLPVNKIPLLHPEWPGWWAKVELHRSDLPPGRTLYMDLDSHVVNSLQPILDYPGDLVMFPTPIPDRKKAHLEKFGWIIRYQAATMLFDPGCKPMQLVWNKFNEDPNYWMNMYRSEQDIMGNWIPDQPMFPREWMIKLDSIVRHEMNKLSEKVIIVTGQPKNGLFHNLKHGLPWLEKLARE